MYHIKPPEIPLGKPRALQVRLHVASLVPLRMTAGVPRSRKDPIIGGINEAKQKPSPVGSEAARGW